MITHKRAPVPAESGQRVTSPPDRPTGAPRRRRRERVIVGLLVLLLVVLAAWLERPTAPSAPDALHVAVLSELNSFTSWLAVNHAQGYIGEVGWPDNEDGDGAQWNALANDWFAAADRSGLWVTAWATGEWWGTGYPLAIYEDRDNGRGVDWANSQASVLEKHPSTASYLRGIDVAGGSFASPTIEETSSFSNLNPGTYEEDYHYDSPATFSYLASRGVRLARIDFRWERLQPTLNGPLDPDELARLDTVVEEARQAGLSVVLDLHNYGAYYLSDGTQGVRRAIGSDQVSNAQLADVWRRLSAHFQGNPTVVAYGLMNEPANLSARYQLQTSYTAPDQAPPSWVPDSGDSAVLTTTTDPTHGATTALRVTKAFPSTPGYGHMRIHDNNDGSGTMRDLSGNGNALSLWVYLPQDEPGTTWQALLFLYGPQQSYTAAESSTTLVDGQWTEVTGEFSTSELSAVQSIGVQVYANDVSGTAWMAVDGLGQGTQETPAQIWEHASQAALSAIRANGDTKLVMVPGYNWSRVQTWTQEHPVGWITDPANNFRYEAHDYWDREQSSFYTDSYEAEVAAASKQP